jgi:hypothetical protein
MPAHTRTDVVETVHAGLRELVRRGSVSASSVHGIPGLLDAARAIVGDDLDDEAAASLVASKLDTAMRHLPEPEREIALMLFGRTPTTSHMQLRVRRAQAARLAGVTRESFRVRREGRLLNAIARDLMLRLAGPPNRQGSRRVLVLSSRADGRREATQQVVALLRALDLEPLEVEDAIREGGVSTLPLADVLRAAIETVQAVIVVLAGDHARPIVWFEAGVVLGLAQQKTVLVQVGEGSGPPFIIGVPIIHLSDSSVARHAFRHRLIDAGCAVDTMDDDWLSAGRFSNADR